MKLTENSSIDEVVRFVNSLHRAEADENKRVYLKAVRVTLLSLGFDSDWVEGVFRDVLENEFRFV